MELEIKPAKRYLTQEQAHVEICGRDSKLYCKLENLSITGAALKVVSALSMPRQKDIIKINIYLKSLKKHHTLYGEIVWTHGLNIGTKFLDPVSAKKKVSRNYSI